MAERRHHCCRGFERRKIALITLALPPAPRCRSDPLARLLQSLLNMAADINSDAHGHSPAWSFLNNCFTALRHGGELRHYRCRGFERRKIALITRAPPTCSPLCCLPSFEPLAQPLQRLVNMTADMHPDVHGHSPLMWEALIATAMPFDR